MLLVSFVCIFLFFLSTSVRKVSAAVNNKAALKDQLERSITHVSQILTDVENKIGRERRILSQIDNELNDDRGPGRMDMADYGINIFWNLSTSQAAPGKFGNFTYTLKTTPSLFPPPQTTSTYGTPPVNWHLTTQEGAGTTDTLYIEDLKKNMASKHYGYFSAFVDELTELIFTKNISDAYNVAAMLSFLMKKNAKEGRFISMGDNLLGVLALLLTWFNTLTPSRVQQQAGVLHHIIQVKDKALSADMNNLINYYDSMFTKEEGQALFEALEQYFIYPEANITLGTVGESIFEAVFSPYFKSEGKRKQKRLVQLILMAVHDVDPNFRTQTEAYSAKGYNLGYFLPGMLGRRSMNYEKVVKKILRKHPKLFKKIKRQFKHDRKNRHHVFSHKQKRHHNYRKSHSGHHRHGHRYEREKITQKSHTDKKNKLANEEIEDDSSKSGAYYGEHSEAYSQENTENIQFMPTAKKQLDKLKQRRQMPLETKPRRIRTAALSIVEHSDVDQADPQYLKQLAIRFLRKRQQNQNFNRNRRLNVPSSEEDICDHSQFLKDSVENDKLHKIREISSYSYEEDRLRMNLYDALRHGNRTFASFRKSNGDVANNQTLRDLSSGADDEWILKKNIYKVFENKKFV